MDLEDAAGWWHWQQFTGNTRQTSSSTEGRVRVKKEASKRTVTELFPNMHEEISRPLLFNKGLGMAVW